MSWLYKYKRWGIYIYIYIRPEVSSLYLRKNINRGFIKIILQYKNIKYFKRWIKILGFSNIFNRKQKQKLDKIWFCSKEVKADMISMKRKGNA